jgi:hypothetical protein
MSNPYQQPHRGVLILVLGVTSLFFAITGPFAWLLGRSDIAAMDAGQMDPEGRSITQVGTIIVTIMMILFVVAMMVLGLGFADAGAASAS